jgi:N-succinyldiaminopimelate aminotransferase
MTIPGPWARAARGAMLLGDDGSLRPTIFGEMSALAASTGAINLGQGFPDEDGPAAVLEAARQAISDGTNQYPPGLGMPVLRQAIAAHQSRFYGIPLDPDREVLVTAGATEAIAATLLALVGDGDEVVTFEPFYDSYAAIIALAGARHVTVPLRSPDFLPDLDELRAAVTDRTRVILINSPHNPTGAVLDRATLELLVELAHRHDAILVTDEVYEHLTFDGTAHTPIATIPGGRERNVAISSGGKTFSTTGWKIGWITARPELVQAITAVKQFLTYVNGAPFQPAIALGLGLPDSYFTDAAATLQEKRDLLSAGLRAAGFEVFRPSGSYFVIADAAPLGYDDAADLCRRLPDLAGVVGIPLTAFVRPERHDGYRSLVRFAFCKRHEVLERASAQLAGLGR